jgi:hypothetical protein
VLVRLVGVVGDCCLQRDVQSLRDSYELVTTPAVTKRDRDRDDLRPATQGYAIEIAHELREEVVGIQLLDEQLQQRSRAGEFRRALRKYAHRARSKLFSPPFRIELLFGPYGVFELTVDGAEHVTAFVHGCTSRNAAHDHVRAAACGGPEPARTQLCDEVPCEDIPHGEVNLVS